MINLIRMNILKMFQMKCIYVLLIISIAIGGIFVLESTDTSTDETEQEILEEQTAGNGENQIGLTITPSIEQYTIIEYLSEFISSGCLVIMIGLFMSILACSERESGFLKNLAACNQHKWKIVIARLIPGIICFFVLTAGMTVFMVIINLLSGAGLVFGSLVEYLPILLIQLLLHIAFAAAVLTIVEISRSLMLTVIFSIFSGLGLIVFIISFVLPKTAGLMMISRIKATVLPLDMTFVPVTLIVGVIALVGYSVLSGFIFQKRDTY